MDKIREYRNVSLWSFIGSSCTNKLYRSSSVTPGISTAISIYLFSIWWCYSYVVTVYFTVFTDVTSCVWFSCLFLQFIWNWLNNCLSKLSVYLFITRELLTNFFISLDTWDGKLQFGAATWSLLSWRTCCRGVDFKTVARQVACISRVDLIK